jgi:hypothetical protein
MSHVLPFVELLDRSQNASKVLRPANGAQAAFVVTF